MACGSVKVVSAATSVARHLWCVRCGLIANVPLGPQHDPYDDEYYARFYKPVIAEQTASFRSLLLSLADPQHRLLDVGCGAGAFLKAASDIGMRAGVGVDPSAAARALAGDLLDGTSMSIEARIQDVKGSFEMVTFIDTIAHIAEVEGLISDIKTRLLSRPGAIVVRTPRINRFYGIYCLSLVRTLAFLGRGAWVSSALLFSSTRLLLFTERALHCFLARQGFREVCLLRSQEHERVEMPASATSPPRWAPLQFLFWFTRILFPKRSMTYVGRLEESP